MQIQNTYYCNYNKIFPNVIFKTNTGIDKKL